MILEKLVGNGVKYRVKQPSVSSALHIVTSKDLRFGEICNRFIRVWRLGLAVRSVTMWCMYFSVLLFVLPEVA